jgi:hypothetical protein
VEHFEKQLTSVSALVCAKKKEKSETLFLLARMKTAQEISYESVQNDLGK